MEHDRRDDPSPLVACSRRRDHAEASVFAPANLLREARRQRALPPGDVPPVCLLDPDGDLVRHLRETGRVRRSAAWACYHTELWETDGGGARIGVVGCAVGAPFAVLVAEQLFASGCKLLVSVASAGRVAADLPASCVILIDRALRGEGTSGCYLPPASFAAIHPAALAAAEAGLARAGPATHRGATWTTDAPYRETASAIASAAAAGALAVEMEAAALYAFAEARDRPVVCFAHVTNQMAQIEGDFEKGPDGGAELTLALALAVAGG